jgi:mono/diheme cytochrome c family protein
MHVIRSLATLLALAAGGAALGAEVDEADRGKALVTSKCARCHAIGLEGESTHPKAPPFRQVVTRYPLDNLEEALAEGIMSGHPDMPEFVFKADEIASILAYLQTLKADPGAADDRTRKP